MSFGPIMTTSYWPPWAATSFSTLARSVFSSYVTNLTLMPGWVASNPAGVSFSMVVMSGLAVTATVIVASPDFSDDDELEQAATVIVTAAAAVMTIGHRRRRRRALVRIMCSSCYELSSDADVPLGAGRRGRRLFCGRCARRDGRAAGRWSAALVVSSPFLVRRRCNVGATPASSSWSGSIGSGGCAAVRGSVAAGCLDPYDVDAVVVKFGRLFHRQPVVGDEPFEVAQVREPYERINAVLGAVGHEDAPP